MAKAFIKTHNNWFYHFKNGQSVQKVFELVFCFVSFYIVSKKMILVTMILYDITDMSCELIRIILGK